MNTHIHSRFQATHKSVPLQQNGIIYTISSALCNSFQGASIQIRENTAAVSIIEEKGKTTARADHEKSFMLQRLKFCLRVCHVRNLPSVPLLPYPSPTGSKNMWMDGHPNRPKFRRCKGLGMGKSFHPAASSQLSCPRSVAFQSITGRSFLSISQNYQLVFNLPLFRIRLSNGERVK